ncbi:MAG: DNA recombination protein RmuC [Bacteroidales bacterium OttesenSCG-928-I14]|jgi:DNA recombination protein RmuC|nr:DNA recombination protein RmuC [Bacteroidales bacterium OttesenSCG-928-I14]
MEAFFLPIVIGFVPFCFILFFCLHKKKIYVLRCNYKILNDKFNEVTIQTKIAENSIFVIQKNNSELNSKLETKENEINFLNRKIAEVRAENKALLEKLSTQKEEITRIQKIAHLQFEKIANQILEEKSNKFIKLNQFNIESILKPLDDNISSFRKKVEETYDKESKIRFSLGEKVKELIEQTNKVSSEANNLANALKNQTKKQGNWGEMILESVLQQSGLTKEREYFLQETIKSKDGKILRPDILVKLPDNRTIIIDSKVSLIAYERYSSTNDLDQQKLHIKDHLYSIRAHINELSNKNYDDLETSLDFTMMFIPIEPAYLVAIQNDGTLWSEAYSKRILLVCPNNLIACLKIINDLWKKEMQSANAKEIVKQSLSLYEKLVGFIETFEKIGKQIEQTQDSYIKAKNQLTNGRNNLINQVIKMKKLGFNSKKEISTTIFSTETNYVKD